MAAGSAVGRGNMADYPVVPCTVKGLDISLAALQRHDPYINTIVDVASQVALYTFSHKANEWEKTDVEGTLFVYTRSASPRHGFTIMNRLSMENRTEPITKDLDFLLQDPFLLYRNARLAIYGIWFYDKEECQRIADVMKDLTRQEQVKAEQGAAEGVSPQSVKPREDKAVDILKMLYKAKDEYNKGKPSAEPKQISNSSAIYNNPNLIKPIPVKPSESQYQPAAQQPTKSLSQEPQHLSLAALFGSHEQTQGTMQQQQQPPPRKGKTSGRHGVARSLSYEEPSRLGATEKPQALEKQLCPAIQKLIAPGAELQPVPELPERRVCVNGHAVSTSDSLTGLFQPVAARNPDPVGAQKLLHQLQGPVAPAMKTEPGAGGPADILLRGMHPPLSAPVRGSMQMKPTYFNTALPSQPVKSQCFSLVAPRVDVPAPTLVSRDISPHELLQKLQLVQEEQQCHGNSRPVLAAKFPSKAPVVSQGLPALKPMDPWMDKAPGAEKPNPLFQVFSPQRIAATIAPTQLMSPMVFAQCAAGKTNAAESGWMPATNTDPDLGATSLLLPSQTPEPSTSHPNTLTKGQLQDTLVYLIKNDANFLNIIYEAYLSGVPKEGVKKKV
ncbi:mRNA-decapping enzyme 1B isoform X2 [Latimeria chalumnae]|uniref:mRNA-decapping enzyme 1B isoform X2 n=1 Tax=Latimeria chalumnae TaxID=7897 RepID=UPI0003C18FEE|nr:PREDICTED: mRNA-decapping enzyme 1B isoform X1 [Latimeria chalumnae]|eukprot:XP_005989498.1 PREDICTED: mRNA-decapping enzyme 1B isoform X1 [Latimeria chalumnae]